MVLQLRCHFICNTKKTPKTLLVLSELQILTIKKLGITSVLKAHSVTMIKL